MLFTNELQNHQATYSWLQMENKPGYSYLILIHGDYAIFYRISEVTIELITIWDSRQDPKKLDIKNK